MRSSSPRSITTPTSPAGSKPPQTKGPWCIRYRWRAPTAHWTPQRCVSASTPIPAVAVSYASNVTGSIVDIKTIVEAAHRVGAQVYVDAVHYAPHNLIDVQALGCDFWCAPPTSSLARTSAWPISRRSGCNAYGRTKSSRPPMSAPAVSRPARKASRRWPALRQRSTIWRSGDAGRAVKAAFAGEFRRLPPA